MSFIDPLPAGSMTLGGKTFGPALNMGRARPHQVGGRMMWIHEDELRDLVVKAGWHTEPDYQAVLADLKKSEAHIDALLAELDAGREKIDALEKAIGFKPKPGRPPKPKTD